MADSPSRAIVVFGDGLVPGVASCHSNLHALASLGCCGFLALRDTDGDEPDLVQLLDLHDALKKGDHLQSMSERFMGMRAAMFTNSEAAGFIGEQAGFSVSFLDDSRQLDPPATLASKFLALVDPEQGDAELLLAHISARNRNGDELVSWLDSLVGQLMKAQAPSRHLLLVLVLGYGNGGEKQLVDEVQPETLDPQLLHLRPVQSFTTKAGKRVESLREHHPLLAVYHQPGVTRRDHCQSFTLGDFHKSGGNLTVLADRFLYEVAFKLWKAPKYGA